MLILNSETFSYVFCVIKNVQIRWKGCKKVAVYVLTQNCIWKRRRHVERQRGDSVIRQVFREIAKNQCTFLYCWKPTDTTSSIFSCPCHFVDCFNRSWPWAQEARQLSRTIWSKYTKKTHCCMLTFAHFNCLTKYVLFLISRRVNSKNSLLLSHFFPK